MDLIRPHTYFLVAAAKAGLPLPYATFNTKVPNGSLFRLDYILVAYNVQVDVEDPTIQTSADLMFTLSLTDGMRYDNLPIMFQDMTTPAGGNRLRKAWGFRMEIPPNAILTMDVRHAPGGSTRSDWVSITYLGKKTWGRR